MCGCTSSATSSPQYHITPPPQNIIPPKSNLVDVRLSDGVSYDPMPFNLPPYLLALVPSNLIQGASMVLKKGLVYSIDSRIYGHTSAVAPGALILVAE